MVEPQQQGKTKIVTDENCELGKIGTVIPNVEIDYVVVVVVPYVLQTYIVDFETIMDERIADIIVDVN